MCTGKIFLKSEISERQRIMNKVMNKVLLKYSQHRTDLFSGVLLLEPTLNPMEMLQMISDTHDSSVFECGGGVGRSTSSARTSLVAERTIAARYWFTFRLNT